MLLTQVMDECREVAEAIEGQEPPNRIQEEIGDLLHIAISLCIFAGFDVEDTLARTNNKFAARMEALKALAKDQGLTDLKGQSIAFMLELWKKAKQRE